MLNLLLIHLIMQKRINKMKDSFKVYCLKESLVPTYMDKVYSDIDFCFVELLNKDYVHVDDIVDEDFETYWETEHS
tara:strand:+ start:20 stop:247 length:228 start_codon:yes stop_codon:yes gene_type:complete